MVPFFPCSCCEVLIACFYVIFFSGGEFISITYRFTCEVGTVLPEGQYSTSHACKLPQHRHLDAR